MATTAIVGEKVGMSQKWVDDKVVPVTVLRVEPMRVVQVKTPERDGYSALQVTYGHRDASKLNKPAAGHFAKASVDPGKRLIEVRLDDVDGYEVGQEIQVDVLAAGTKVDVTAVSKGKGFAGTMKRHNFSGQGASHGNHKHHRAPGSIGAASFPGRVFKGVRMAGHLGHEQVTTLNLEVVESDPERNLLLVKGSVPGPTRRRRRRPQRRQVTGREGLSTMAEITVKNVTGKKAGTVTLDEATFAVQPNVPLMHQVVTAQLASRRAGTQSTKTRSEVRGGGAKPYRQKGTGRARQGSTNAPHFSGGGVSHAPKPRSYHQRTPKKMIRAALRSALSDRANDDKIVVVDSWGLDAPKTKDAAAAIAALGVDGRVLVVLDREDINAALSFRNLPDVQIIHTGELNAYDVLCNDYIVFTTASLEAVNSTATERSPVVTASAPDRSTDEATTGVASASEQPDASESSSEPETQPDASESSSEQGATAS